VANIVLISDLRTMRYVPANLAQISEFAPEIECIYLVTNCLPQEDLLLRLKKISIRLRLNLKIVHLNNFAALPSNFQTLNHVPSIAVTKLFLGEILPDLDFILYMDIDTVVRESISHLLHFKLHTSIAAVEELSQNWMDAPKDMKFEQYFNTGVMLISLRKFREKRIAEKVSKIVGDKTVSNSLQARFVDQDVFNFLFADDVTLLPRKYNHFSCNDRRLGMTNFFQEPAIVHFVGIEKPWDYPGKSKFTREWVSYFESGLGQLEDSNDTKIIRSMSGFLGISKIVTPLIKSLVFFRREVARKLPMSLKKFLRRF